MKQEVQVFFVILLVFSNLSRRPDSRKRCEVIYGYKFYTTRNPVKKTFIW